MTISDIFTARSMCRLRRARGSGYAVSERHHNESISAVVPGKGWRFHLLGYVCRLYHWFVGYAGTAGVLLMASAFLSFGAIYFFVWVAGFLLITDDLPLQAAAMRYGVHPTAA